MIPTRLRRTIPLRRRRRCPGKNHNLTVVGHVHVEPLLRDRREARTARCLSNLALELHLARLELRPLPVEGAKLESLRDSEAPPPNDACGHQEETEQCERDDGPPAHPGLLARHATPPSATREGERCVISDCERARRFPRWSPFASGARRAPCRRRCTGGGAADRCTRCCIAGTHASPDDPRLSDRRSPPAPRLARAGSAM